MHGPYSDQADLISTAACWGKGLLIESRILGLLPPHYEQDTKLTAAFDELFRQQGVHLVGSPLQSAISNCYVEFWIGGFERQCLNPLAILN